MQVLYRQDSKTVQHNNACTVTEYKIDKDNQIDCAIIALSGRYPLQGSVMNQICKEMAYVVNGSGKIVVEDKEILMTVGDVVLIEPGEKYYWEGEMRLFVSCTPAWDPAQHTAM